MINGHYIQITLISNLEINNSSATDLFKNGSNQSVSSFHSAALKVYHYNIGIKNKIIHGNQNEWSFKDQ